ncbi:hypothetical protein HY251_08895 [bacterium]|nr:hypothetical protein [bacterium]
MRPLAPALGVLLLLSLIAQAQDTPKEARSTYHDTLYKFALDSPRFEKCKKADTTHVLSFLGSRKKGFQNNVNLMLQPPMKRKEYATLTTGQLGAAGLTVSSSVDKTVSGRDASLWDYEGTVSGHELRFLALAVFDDEHVFLLTCTCEKDDFEDCEKGFRACLDSFKFDDEKF